MARKLFVLVALAAMVLAASAPVALAQGGQAGVVGPQPVEWTGEEATVTGLLEADGEKLDRTPVWTMEDEASGDRYHVEQGEGVDLLAFEGQNVSLHGQLGYLEGAVILVDSVETLEGQTSGEAQYAPEGVPGEEFSGTGVVEYLDDKADGTPVYGFSVSPEEGHYVEGDFDFAAFEGQRVTVAGQFVYYRGGGSYLRVKSIEPADERATDDAEAIEETVPSIPSGEPEVVEVQEVVPVVPGTIDASEETVAVELASEQTPLAVEVDGIPDEPGFFSAAAKALPVTGGVALLLPLAGFVLLVAGLAAFRMTR